VAEGKWRYPFVFTVPLFNKSQYKSITDIEADSSIESLDAGRIVPAAVADINGGEVSTAVTQTQEPHSPEFTAAEFRLVLAIVEHPMLVSSEYVKLAGVSPNTLRKLRLIFLEKGFIREHTTDSGNRGRSARRWEPLEPAHRAVKKHTNLRREQ
jgi:GTPase